MSRELVLLVVMLVAFGAGGIFWATRDPVTGSYDRVCHTTARVVEQHHRPRYTTVFTVPSQQPNGVTTHHRQLIVHPEKFSLVVALDDGRKITTHDREMWRNFAQSDTLSVTYAERHLFYKSGKTKVELAILDLEER